MSTSERSSGRCRNSTIEKSALPNIKLRRPRNRKTWLRINCGLRKGIDACVSIPVGSLHHEQNSNHCIAIVRDADMLLSGIEKQLLECGQAGPNYETRPKHLNCEQKQISCRAGRFVGRFLIHERPSDFELLRIPGGLSARDIRRGPWRGHTRTAWSYILYQRVPYTAR
jgi:hypothetical protein